MRINSIIAAGCLSIVVLSSGCGTLVSRDQFLDTSYAQSSAAVSGDRSAVVLGYVAPRAAPASEDLTRSVVLHTDAFRTPDAYEVNNMLRLRSEVRNELESLDRDLARVSARAMVKSAAARAALEPKLRDFRSSRVVIEDSFAAMRASDADTSLTLHSRINQALADARMAAIAAATAVDSAPATQGSAL